MRAVTFQGKRSVTVESVPDPRLESPTDAVVKVHLAGICGSDLHVYHERERGLDRGTVMGHEFVGEIVELGDDVRSFVKGSRVLSPFTTSCGGCSYCREGLTARCGSGELFGWVQEGRGLHGAQAEYVRVPLAESTLVRVPDGVGEKEALLLGDVLSTGFFGARMAGVRPGGRAAVVGCGPVGLMAVAAARELGAEEIFAIDSIPERLALAERFGATPVDHSRQDVPAVVREATGGRGADGVVEAVGSAAAGRLAVDLVRTGGTLAIVGVHTEDELPFSPSEAYDKNLTFRTGRCPARAILEELIPLVQEKKYDMAAAISHERPLDEGAAGYRIFDRKEDGCIKVALRP
jgi:threonine dehydrogenase-like Zn-dependent dehydrogenase